jgi:LPS sulfotransferase NodH
MNYKIDKFPIIILSSPRTGSTLLAQIIKSKYSNLKLFLEPDASNTMDDFIEYSNNSNQYILKFHLKQLFKFPQNINKKIFNNDAFLIRIQRKNEIDQIVSNYIELYRNIWYYDKNIMYKEEIIPIDLDSIQLSINTVRRYNNILNNLNIKYDLDIYYENLIIGEDIHPTSGVTPKPINHIQLYQAIEEHLLRKI